MRMKKPTRQLKKDLLLIIKQNGICFSMGEKQTVACKRCPITFKDQRRKDNCYINSADAYSRALRIFVAHYGKEELLDEFI